MVDLSSLSPELVWGLFTRGLGLVFLISFASLAGQIVRCAGPRGGVPIGPRLAKIAEDFPTWRRFYYFPTLLWLGSGAAMLQALTSIGLCAAALVIYGGPYSLAALLTCYVCYLSLDMAVGLLFPWDSLLFEAAVFSLFLPATLALPELAAVAAPAPALTWAYRLLLFRVMFGFGKQKFIGSTGKDLAYLKGFLINQPLPSPLGWYAQKQPVALLRPLVLFMFVAEIPVPFFALFPGDLSLVCALVTTFLMIGIQLMGSFGYFSLLTIALCIPLFDNVTPGQLRLRELFASGAPLVTNAYVLVHTLCASFAFLFNSWVAQIWMLWSFWYRLPRIWQLPLDFVRFMHPFRWLHPYGVFPPNVGPSVKMSLLVEVSWDGHTWHEEEFPYSPSNARSAPKFIAPHHPRGDQAVIYETFGMNPTSLVSSMVGAWDPYAYGAQPGSNTLVQRITEGHGTLFLKGEVLAKHEEPPRAVRLTTVMLEPAPLKQHFATGEWWKRTYVGPHAPPREHDPLFWSDCIPEPELWHFDAIFWRRRSRLGRLMERARAGKEDPLALAIEGGGDLTPADVRRFFDELVPMVTPARGQGLDALCEVVPRVRERWGRRDQRALYRMLNRLSLVLVARLEPLYLYRGNKPEIPARTYFHLWMLAHHILGLGERAYLEAVADPRKAAEHLPDLTAHSGLFYLGVFRYEAFVFEAQKLRLVQAISPPHDEEGKRRVAYSAESMGKAEQFVARLAEAASGYFSVMPYLRDAFQGPRFDSGYPELYPFMEQRETGEVAVRAYRTQAEPPRAAPPASSAEEVAPP